MLDDLIKEIQELQEYKRKYERALKDKQRMSDKLYEYMMDEYNNTPYEEREKYHIKQWCRCCRWKPFDEDKCDKKLPEDIGIPTPSSNAYYEYCIGDICDAGFRRWRTTRLSF